MVVKFTFSQEHFIVDIWFNTYASPSWVKNKKYTSNLFLNVRSQLYFSVLLFDCGFALNLLTKNVLGDS